MGLSFRTKEFMFSDASVIPERIDAHVHLYHEFLYFKNGEASYVAGSSTQQLTPGDIIVTKPHIVHAISFSGNSEYSRTFIQLSPGMLSHIPHDLIRFVTGRSSKDSVIIPKTHANAYDLYSFFEKGLQLLSDRNKRNTYLAWLLFLEFAVRINEVLEKELINSSQAHENAIIGNIKRYLDSNFSRTVNLDELSREFFMNKYSLCHLFKSETGITISDYISLKRIAAVRQLLQDNSLNEIYRQCGFNDYSAFYRTVKKYTGLKPSEFYKET